MDNGRGHQQARSTKKSSNGHQKGHFTWTVTVAISWPGQQKEQQWPPERTLYMDNGRGHQQARSTKKSSNGHQKGHFTWTVAVAFSYRVRIKG
jgi:hypothetical protein